MDRDREKIAERVLHITLEIIFELTGEDYTVVKKTSSGCCQAPVSEGWGRPVSPIMEPPPHPLIHEDINEQKILELAYKMIELLTGEVPIRCQDVAVYSHSSMEKYLEGHKDLYKGVMTEVPHPLTLPVPSSKRTSPERCPRPFLPQDCAEENPDVPQDHQGEDVTQINTTATYVSWDEWSKEKISTYDYPDECSRSSEAQPLLMDSKADNHSIIEDANNEHTTIPCIPPAPQSKNLSCDIHGFHFSDAPRTVPSNKSQRSDAKNQKAHQGKKPGSSSDCGKIKINKSPKLITHQKDHSAEKPYSCPEGDKSFTYKSQLIKHAGIHTAKKPFSCSECGKSYSTKATLLRHQKNHTGEKPFSCPECGKCFTLKSGLDLHHRTHLVEKPYSCSDCGKCFKQKSNLVTHRKIHKGEKPFSCAECGRCFIHKHALLTHQRLHSGEKPFACTECGKCFKKKSYLSLHQKSHTGEKPFSCPECGKSYKTNSYLSVHQRIHAGEKPFACTKCGKCFTRKQGLLVHQRFHTGLKPFACIECGKCFTQKSDLSLHQRIHTGEKPFACTKCGKCFNYKQVLCIHQRTHTGEKPFACTECGKCFTQKSNLTKHQKSHTRK